MAMREVIDANHDYLTSRTNYLSRSEIGRFVTGHFRDYSFCESLFLKSSKRGRIISRISRVLPVLPRVYSMLRARVLFFRKGFDLSPRSRHVRPTLTGAEGSEEGWESERRS